MSATDRSEITTQTEATRSETTPVRGDALVASVRDLLHEGTVRRLVGPRAAGFGETAPDPPRHAHCPPVPADAVDLRVVGQDPQHPHTVLCEPCHRPVQEACAGVVAFVGQRLDVGDPGVVIDGDVEEVIAVTAAPELLTAPV